ncbi:hypothetical protein GP486_007002 [Trichoglossum hirsutum]|uniref:Uncharacterized protein n=1 Tax=Trichoglossum hirsutum TaxID=265104 RepID=A0A9P8IGH8_9PEZI|nr:hypothetical protein GP486_007002 [Trichoglossum hirsutum]
MATEMLSEPCVEFVGVWATWDGVQDHPAKVQPVPNTRIPILRDSDPNIKAICLRRTIRLENPAVKLGNDARCRRSSTGGGSVELSDFDVAEMRLIGSPVNDPPRSIRRHIFPKVTERKGLIERKDSPMLLVDPDSGASEGSVAARHVDAHTPQDIVPDTAPKGRPSDRSSESTPHTKLGDSRSLRDDMGPLLSVVEDPNRSDRIRFVVLPDDKRFASGSTAEISLPSGPSSTVGGGDGDTTSAGGEVNALVAGSLKQKVRNAGSKAESTAEESNVHMTANRKAPETKGCDQRTKGSCSKPGPLLEVKNPSSSTPPQELRATNRKAASQSKKAPWKSPSQEDYTAASKTSPNKLGSLRQSAKESRQSCLQQSRGSRSSAASPRSTQSEKSPFPSRRGGRTVGRSSGSVFNLFMDDSCTDELVSLQRKPRLRHPWSGEDPSTPTKDGSGSQSNSLDFQFTPETAQRPDSQEILEITDKLQSSTGDDFELELLSPVRKEWARLVESSNEAPPQDLCPLNAPILLYDSDFSGSPNSTHSHILGPFTIVKGGVLFACFPAECIHSTLQLEFEATIAIADVARNRWSSLEIPGLPWSEKTMSRAALIIEDERRDSIFQFRTPTFDEKFLHRSNSSIVGKFDLREPLQILFRKKQEIQRLADFEIVLGTHISLAYDVVSGINSHYSLTLYISGLDGRALDVYADRVCIEFTIRNGPRDILAYSIRREKSSQQLTPSDQVDETGGRKVIVMCDAADVGCPITIDFGVGLGYISRSTEAPFIQPKIGEGRVTEETITIAEIPPPLRASFSCDDSRSAWLHAQHPASNTTLPGLHKFIRNVSTEVPENGFHLNLFLLDNYYFHDICLNMDDRLAPISSLRVLIYEAPRAEITQCGQSLLECEMLIDYEVQEGRLSRELIEFVANGWRPSYALVNGRVAEKGQFYETSEGEVAFLRSDKILPGEIVSLKLYWTMRPDSQHRRCDKSDQGLEHQHHRYEIPWVDERAVYRISVGCDIEKAVITGRNGPGQYFRYTAMKGWVRKLPFMFFDPHIALEVPCMDLVDPPLKPTKLVDHHTRHSHRRNLWSLSKGNFLLMLTTVFCIAFLLYFKEPGRLTPDGEPLMGHLGFFGQRQSTPVRGDFSTITGDNREGEETVAQSGGLFLGNGEFLPDGQHTLQEEGNESRPGDALADSIGRVFCSIRGC